MSTTEKVRPYEAIRAMIEGIGGTMIFLPMGAGGDWELQLHGKRVVVPCRDQSVNSIDRFYEATRPDPKTWADYAPDAALVPDAFWKLMHLFQSETHMNSVAPVV